MRHKPEPRPLALSDIDGKYMPTKGPDWALVCSWHRGGLVSIKVVTRASAKVTLTERGRLAAQQQVGGHD